MAAVRGHFSNQANSLSIFHLRLYRLSRPPFPINFLCFRPVRGNDLNVVGISGLCRAIPVVGIVTNGVLRRVLTNPPLLVNHRAIPSQFSKTRAH